MKRIGWIDVIKAVCIVLVVWTHYLIGGIVNHWILSSLLQSMFFVSGYLFKPERPLGSELGKKLRTIMVPYWFYLVLWLPFSLAFEHQSMGEFLTDMTYYTGMLQWHTPLWFLATLFTVWLICALLWKILPGRIPQYVLAAGCIVVSILLPRSLSFLKAFGILRALACVPMYLFGYWAREWNLVQRIRKRPVVLALILAAGLVLTLVLSPQISLYFYRYGTYLYMLVGGLAVCIGLSALLSHRERYPQAVTTVANGTIFVLSTHMPLVLVYRRYLEPAVLLRGELFMTLVTGALVVVTVAIQYLLMLQIRKYPRIATLFGLR